MALEKNDQDNIKILSPDELHRVDNNTTQNADVLIAQEDNKNAKNRVNLNEAPYIHSSTNGFMAPGSSQLRLLKISSLKPYFIAAVIFAIIGLAIQYITTGHVHIHIQSL